MGKFNPKFQEFIVNEIVKSIGSNLASIPLIDRLEKAYEVICKQPKIKNKMLETDFFLVFVKSTTSLVLKKDNKSMEDLIHLAYFVLCDKENVMETYHALYKELKAGNQEKNQRGLTL